MDVVLMIVYATLVLGLLVFIHEGGHYLASRAFGVRVTEFMLGMPGPNIGFTRWGTKFGVTPILLGGYAKVCGMESGDMSPHLEKVLAALYARGTATMEEVALDCGISDDEAYAALEQLTGWGSIVGPTKKDQYNTYRTPEVKPTGGQIKAAVKAGLPAPFARELGEPSPITDAHEFFESEYAQQYRAQPFWKRSVILVAGVAINLIFALLLFVLLFSVIGVDVQNSVTGVSQHILLTPLQSMQYGCEYMIMVVQAVAGLFNPATAAETVSNSSSIIGIAAMSKEVVDAGLVYIIQFVAMISVSLGIMNLLPIPPLDGGRLAIEIIQKISGRNIPEKIVNSITAAGMALFMIFFVFMVNQDIQRYVFGNW